MAQHQLAFDVIQPMALKRWPFLLGMVAAIGHMLEREPDRYLVHKKMGTITAD